MFLDGKKKIQERERKGLAKIKIKIKKKDRKKKEKDLHVMEAIREQGEIGSSERPWIAKAVVDDRNNK